MRFGVLGSTVRESDIILLHQGNARLQTFSAVKPYSRICAGAGAEAPKLWPSRNKRRSNPAMIPIDGGRRGIDSFVDRRVPITRAQGYLTLFFDQLLEAWIHPRRFSDQQQENPNTSADCNDREVSPRIPG